MDWEELTGLPVSGGFIIAPLDARGVVLTGQVCDAQRGANRTTCAAFGEPIPQSTIRVWTSKTELNPFVFLCGICDSLLW